MHSCVLDISLAVETVSNELLSVEIALDAKVVFISSADLTVFSTRGGSKLAILMSSPRHLRIRNTLAYTSSSHISNLFLGR